MESIFLIRVQSSTKVQHSLHASESFQYALCISTTHTTNYIGSKQHLRDLAPLLMRTDPCAVFTCPSFSSFSFVLAVPLFCLVFPCECRVFFIPLVRFYLHIFLYFEGEGFCASLTRSLCWVQWINPILRLFRNYMAQACHFKVA